jgi:pimeloyl-ACP methyl ester carboxylesterase
MYYFQTRFYKFKFGIKIHSLLSIIIIYSFIIQSCVSTEKFIKEEDKVQIYKTTNIGGVPQAIYIRGKNLNNPVLLFLHGGPGYPFFPFLAQKKVFSKLEKHFTIVYWEQRGTGKSYSKHIPPESMNVQQFISDTKEVITYSLAQLNKEKLFLWGHSWGSSIGAMYASRYPEMLYAYISTGQSVNPIKNEQLGYEFVEQKAFETNNLKALQQLAGIDTTVANYKLADALILRKWIYQYGGIVQQTEYERPYIDYHDIWLILTTPMYSVKDKISIVRNPYFSAQHLWGDLKKMNLTKDAYQIDVPVFFIVGRWDIIVHHLLAEEYFKTLIAPSGKTLYWFEESAHRPFVEEKDKFFEIFINEIRPIYENPQELKSQ